MRWCMQVQGSLQIDGSLSQKGHTSKRGHCVKSGLKNRSELRANLSKLQEWQRGSLKKNKKKDQLNRLYNVNQRGLSVATEEVRQRLVALSARLQRYEA